MYQSSSEKVAMSVGCTANVVIITPTEIYVANAGDSRCVACDKKKGAIELSKDHKPDNPEEK
jgi:serine/threonine protein phosphatase PrpC